MKNLVVYYSLEGNTQKAAEKIAQGLNADILKLEPVKDVPKNNGKYFIGGMQAMFGACVKIKPIKLNPKEYDRIILGTPVWADKAAPAVNTFLKKYNVEDKVTALFTVSGGGNNERCESNMKKKLHHLKAIVALTDVKNPISSENDRRLKDFVGELLRGQ